VSASSGARAGITNTATLCESSDPCALLHTLDALAPKAPAAISADFAAFERLEHLLLGPRAGRPDGSADCLPFRHTCITVAPEAVPARARYEDPPMNDPCARSDETGNHTIDDYPALLECASSPHPLAGALKMPVSAT
jgi:hypothetical protein